MKLAATRVARFLKPYTEFALSASAVQGKIDCDCYYGV